MIITIHKIFKECSNYESDDDDGDDDDDEQNYVNRGKTKYGL